jgi:hypothetical protein
MRLPSVKYFSEKLRLRRKKVEDVATAQKKFYEEAKARHVDLDRRFDMVNDLMEQTLRSLGSKPKALPENGGASDKKRG